MKLLSVEETASLLRVKSTSLVDRRFRDRIGLPAVRVGRGLQFLEDDVNQLIIRRREVLTTTGREEVTCVLGE